MSEFFQMGGYAPYVWGSYGVATFLMLAVFVMSWISWRQNEKTLIALKSVRNQARDSKRAA